MATEYLNNLTQFKFWCQKVLPLVYDDSLSYYETLCKVVDYINAIISDSGGLVGEVNQLKAELAIVQDWIANFNTAYAEQIIKDKIATMIFVEITQAGYIVYYIPDNWTDITFNTTGLDINLPDAPDYGRLVLSY